jgi:recombinational DNA repair ATPase RecF
MKIIQLELHHFRGIQNLTLSFDEPLTVMIGANGAGIVIFT